VCEAIEKKVWEHPRQPRTDEQNQAMTFKSETSFKKGLKTTLLQIKTATTEKIQIY